MTIHVQVVSTCGSRDEGVDYRYFALLICIFDEIQGARKYKKCKVYHLGEAKPKLARGRGRHCVNSGAPIKRKGRRLFTSEKFDFCLEYKCPKLECNGTKIISRAGMCDRCKGDCEWLGKIVKHGGGGTCEDGCNTCGCRHGRVTFSTRMLCPLAFCLPENRRG
ncbi:hypothetical protein FSP39_023651 [Pinctada imbricata]|uniref:Uncharacterized protein n=1 Tax=Pinctada imbricata TaxID=66713 RepID=A0AA88YLP2_PINIB|nr:hypothetical protein FSP39_023651 [Pinctada imbricata]